MSRLLHVDDDLRVETYLDWLNLSAAPNPEDEVSRRLLSMLAAALARSVTDLASGSTSHAAEQIWADAQARADLTSLFEVLRLRLTTRGYPVATLESFPNVPLRVHARYTRDEILAGIGARQQAVRPPSWQSGVWFESAASADLFAFTLDKSGKSFSPSTRYRDYAISDSLIHWESQSATKEAGETGQRYINHQSQGTSVLLFARESVADRAFWFLGPATYVRHEGERPMAITWRLQVPLPDDLYGVMAAAVA